METMQLVGLIVGSLLGAAILIGILISSLYRKATKEISFVRTGMGGQRVIMNRGSMVIPVIHDVIKINMNTLRLEVRRANEQALITRDRMRVDVTAEFYVRVKPTEDAIADAAQTLGQRTLEPMSLKELIEGKFVDALRAVAAEMEMEELHEKRVDFVQKVQATVSEDLLKNGLELEAVSLTSLDQTGQEFFNPQNAFDAQGLTKLTEQIETRRKERNDIEQETRVQIETKNLEAEQRSLDIHKDEEYAKLKQEREIEIRRASQMAEIAKEQAEKNRDAREAEIAANQLIEQKDIVAKQAIEQQRIEMQRDIEQREIEKIRTIETADIEKAKTIELGEQDKAIAIAEKSKAKSEAEAEAAHARAEMVKADEQVITVMETEIAERQKTIELVRAAENAEKDAIKVTVAARAEHEASQAHAEAARVAARGTADAEIMSAEASAKTYEVEAEGQRGLHEAKNVLNEEIIAMEIKKVLIEALPKIIAESVKPMEQIDGIKIIQVDGMTGGGSNGNGVKAAAASGSLADQLVNSALRYRGQAPLIDALMSEVGLKGGDLNGLTGGMLETDGEPSKDEKPEDKSEEPKKAVVSKAIFKS